MYKKDVTTRMGVYELVHRFCLHKGASVQREGGRRRKRRKRRNGREERRRRMGGEEGEKEERRREGRDVCRLLTSDLLYFIYTNNHA